ncbi:heavy metal translocating P-type ATPase [Clostridium sp. E02]|uniref:heavy metal translocating P-type ATPase n=1 Tax=Clostridium sp. E02 TaxID=2487134 RepID=UPI000F5394FC|nr:heavy metal translocating P-type ATPase [Clostridium sp. E02]
MTKKQKKMGIRLLVSAVFFTAGMLVKGKVSWYFLPFIISYLAAGYDIPLKALRNIKNGQFFDENFLMSVATFGAIGIGAMEEAVGVMLFYQIGELFNDYAVNRSRNSISELMDINPEYANLIRNGKEEKIDPYEVEIGDIIVVKPGEKVPLDGVVVKGSSGLDTKALTGESMPVEVQEHDPVISGSINLNGVLEVKVNRLFDDSTVSKILEMVENASSRKAKAENFITRFARIYTPIVVVLALLLAIIPSLVTGEWGVWIYRACSFLVVSCPCALVISVPLSFFGGLGAASRQGILLKGSNYLEAMASLNAVVFDKTGTLTTGKFTVTEVNASAGTKEELLKLTAYGEYHSNHPIAMSVKEAFGKPVDESQILKTEEIAGYGIRAEVKDKDRVWELFIGNERLMKQQGIAINQETSITGTTLFVADRDKYLGSITISDTIREDVPKALKGLREAGVERLIMLTGDKPEVGKLVGETLGLDEIYGGLLPGDKVNKVEELLAKKSKTEMLAFVGDGINDAPVLARADVGIAMGGIGSDAAVEAADVVIMTDEPSKLVDTILIARKTVGIVKQNIVFAIGIKILILALSAVGIATMWAAVFGDVGVSVLAILNAVRALKYKGRQ